MTPEERRKEVADLIRKLRPDIPNPEELAAEAQHVQAEFTPELVAQLSVLGAIAHALQITRVATVESSGNLEVPALYVKVPMAVEDQTAVFRVTAEQV